MSCSDSNLDEGWLQMEVSISAQDDCVPSAVPTNAECISSSCFPGTLRAHVQRALQHASTSHPEIHFTSIQLLTREFELLLPAGGNR